MTARRRELVSGLGPPSLTDIAMSLPMRVKVLAMADQRFIFRALRNSNALPMTTKIKKPSAFVQIQEHDVDLFY